MLKTMQLKDLVVGDPDESKQSATYFDELKQRDELLMTNVEGEEADNVHPADSVSQRGDNAEVILASYIQSLKLLLHCVCVYRHSKNNMI